MPCSPTRRNVRATTGSVMPGSGGPGSGGPGADFADLGNFGDLFNDLFGDIFGGGGGRGREPPRARTARRGPPVQPGDHPRRRGERLRATPQDSAHEPLLDLLPARVRRRGPSPRAAGGARGRDSSSSSRASSGSTGPATPAAVRARSSTNPCPTCRGAGRVEGPADDPGEGAAGHRGGGPPAGHWRG
jgi:molecular chaperone DnaJ